MSAELTEKTHAGPFVRRPPPYVVALGLVFVAYVIRYVVMTPTDYMPDGDGFYIYQFARSMAFDGDLDFTNDYAICGDRWGIATRDTGTAHPSNPWYIGPSLLWTPFVAALRLVLPLEHVSDQVRLGCRGPIPYALGFLAPVFTVVTLAIARRIARRFASERASVIAILVVGFGSPLIVYGTWVWSYAHVWGAFTLTTGVLFAIRTFESPSALGNWIGMGFFFGWAGLMRPHHGAFLLTPFVLTLAFMASAARERRIPVAEAMRGLLCLAAFSLITGVRLWSYQYMYGSPWPPMLRSVYLQPAHAHPWLVLFSARSGLLCHTPLAWFALIGMVFFFPRARGKRVFALSILAPLALDYWVCCSPLVWTATATIGARLLTSFAGLFVVFSAMTFDRILAFLEADARRIPRLALGATLVPALALSWNLNEAGAPLDAPGLYGGAFRRIVADVYSVVGNPMTFPAPVVFAARYRMPASRFDLVADYGLFSHEPERGRLDGIDRIHFGHLPPEVVADSRASVATAGLRLVPRRESRIVYPLAWPYVTDLEIVLAQPAGREGCRIRIENHLFFRGTVLGRVSLAADRTRFTVHAPQGAFDSGIDETRFVSNCALTIESMRFVDSSGEASDSFLRRPAPAQAPAVPGR